MPCCLSEAENQAVTFVISSAIPGQVKGDCSHIAVFQQLGPCCAIMLQIDGGFSFSTAQNFLIIYLICFAIICLFPLYLIPCTL